MKVFFVYAHPNPNSLNAKLKDHAVGALQRAGHEVRISDLYATHSPWRRLAPAKNLVVKELGFEQLGGPRQFVIVLLFRPPNEKVPDVGGALYIVPCKN